MPRHFRVIAVQPKWHPHDFISAAAFRAWMRSQLDMARPYLAADRPNLVVLTELNGLPLVLRGGAWAIPLKKFERVATALFISRLARTLPILRREGVSPVRALQLADADRNTRLYLHTCRDLAREYGVYLCCGSAPTPRYQLVQGQPRRMAGTLTNQAVILDPRGALVGATDKVHLTPDEEQEGVDLTPGHLDEMRVFPTPVGDLGVAISLDAFRADVIGRLEKQGCTVLLQPDANGAPWTAKEGLPPDPTNIRDQPEAWLESSWTATTQGKSIRYAINPMVVGNLLDLTFDGQSAITGRAEDAPEQRNYALTTPRPGFLALTPWVETGTPEQLRRAGTQRAAHSGHPLENNYRTDTLWADLTLPDTTLTTPERNRHEEALEYILSRQGRPKPGLTAAVILAGLSTLAYLTWRSLRRR